MYFFFVIDIFIFGNEHLFLQLLIYTLSLKKKVFEEVQFIQQRFINWSNVDGKSFLHCYKKGLPYRQDVTSSFKA